MVDGGRVTGAWDREQIQSLFDPSGGLLDRRALRGESAIEDGLPDVFIGPSDLRQMAAGVMNPAAMEGGTLRSAAIAMFKYVADARGSVPNASGQAGHASDLSAPLELRTGWRRP